MVVLEGVLAVPAYTIERKGLRRHDVLLEPEKWRWAEPAIKSVNDRAFRLNQILDVVTFIGQDVADAAAEWFVKYGVGVSSTQYSDFDQFCATLNWRTDIDQVFDANPDRFVRYGQRGYAIQGGTF